MKFSIYTVLFAMLSVGTMFIRSDRFVESLTQPKLFLFLVVVSVCAAVGAVSCFRSDRKIGVDALSLVLMVFAGYCLVRSCFAVRIDRVFLCTSIAALVLYGLFRRYGDEGRFGSILSVTVFGQALYGLALPFFDDGARFFSLCGSYDNPAGFAAVSAVGLPFILHGTVAANRRWRVASYIMAAVTMVAIVLSGSRAGILAVCTVLVVSLNDRYRFLRSVKVRVFAVLLVVSASGMLFLVKRNSAIGRILIWRTTLDMVTDAPVAGLGRDCFLARYMDYQADYFEQHPDSRYAMLADNVSHPFNEYLAVAAQFGVVGLLLLAAVAVVVCRNARAATTPVSCLLAFAVFACFSYPLRYPFVYVLVLYSLSGIAGGMDTKLRVPSRVCGVVLSAAAVWMAHVCVVEIKNELCWKRAVVSSTTCAAAGVPDAYGSLYYRWKNPFFLYNYAAVLNSEGRYADSNEVLAECRAGYNDYDIQMLTGDNYVGAKDTDGAVRAYERAGSMCPNRFMPLYNIFKKYVAECDYEEAG